MNIKKNRWRNKLFLVLSLMYFSPCRATIATLPHLVIHPASQDAVAIWEEHVGSHRQIHSSTMTAGVWSPPATISNIGMDSFSPLIAMNQSGDCVALWAITDIVNNIISLQSSQLPFGGVWSIPVTITTINESLIDLSETQNFHFKLVINSNTPSDILAIWSSHIGTDLAVRASTATFGGGWSAPIQLSP